MISIADVPVHIQTPSASQFATPILVGRSRAGGRSTSHSTSSHPGTLFWTRFFCGSDFGLLVQRFQIYKIREQKKAFFCALKKKIKEKMNDVCCRGVPLRPPVVLSHAASLSRLLPFSSLAPAALSLSSHLQPC